MAAQPSMLLQSAAPEGAMTYVRPWLVQVLATSHFCCSRRCGHARTGHCQSLRQSADGVDEACKCLWRVPVQPVGAERDWGAGQAEAFEQLLAEPGQWDAALGRGGQSQGVRLRESSHLLAELGQAVGGGRRGHIGGRVDGDRGQQHGAGE